MSRIFALLALCLLPFVSPACDKVPLLAPTGSTITLSINSTTVPLNGTAQVTAIVLESGGTAPQNGTVVTFTTTLGAIDPLEARTENGRATTTLNAGTRSGTANVRAFSGDAGGDDSSTAEVEVFIGAAGEGVTVILRPDGSTNGGTVTSIVATVLDREGNPTGGVAVAFGADHGQISPAIVTTDANGEARTTLTTSEETTVSAQAGVAVADLTIGAPGSLALAVTTPQPPTPAEVGLPVIFTITPTGAFFSNVVVDFGDGQQESLGPVSAERTFSHTYTRRGTFTVTATGTSGGGVVSPASTSVTVNDRAPISVAVIPSPANVSVASNVVVSFSATATLAGSAPPIARVDWSFGDGQSRTTTGLTTTYRYSATGTFTVTVKVVSTDGREGTGVATVRVSP